MILLTLLRSSLFYQHNFILFNRQQDFNKNKNVSRKSFVAHHVNHDFFVRTCKFVNDRAVRLLLKRIRIKI